MHKGLMCQKKPGRREDDAAAGEAKLQKMNVKSNDEGGDYVKSPSKDTSDDAVVSSKSNKRRKKGPRTEKEDDLDKILAELGVASPSANTDKNVPIEPNVAVGNAVLEREVEQVTFGEFPVEKMKMAFLDILSAPVDDKNWVTLVNEDIRVLRNRIDVHNIPGTVSCIAVSTFRLEATPLEAYNFLTKHLQKIQDPWPIYIRKSIIQYVKYNR